MRKHVIWTDQINPEDWKEGFIEFCEINNLDPDDLDLTEWAYEENAFCLEAEQMNLDILLPDEIIALADLGLWDGRRTGYKEMHTNRLSDCLYSHTRGFSYNTWYVDEDDDFCHEETHHDGTNHIVYRMWKPDVDEYERDDILADIYDGEPDAGARMYESTLPLGSYIQKVYGWTN